MKVMDNRRRTLNDIISTTFLLNVGTVPTVWYIFFHFIIGYEKKTAELQLLKKYGCDRLP
jgi:ABC-type anion transport system duplicated permease subunit